MTNQQPVPTLVRLEYWNPVRRAWSVGHAGVALLFPEKYTLRLAANGKTARAIELDDQLNPTGRVWGPDAEPVPEPECAECLGTLCDGLPPGQCLI